MTKPMVEWRRESMISQTKYLLIVVRFGVANGREEADPEDRARTCPTIGSYPNTGSSASILERNARNASGMMTSACVIATSNSLAEQGKPKANQERLTDGMTRPSSLCPIIESIPFCPKPSRRIAVRGSLDEEE